MNINVKIALLGGDMRQLYVAHRLNEENVCVSLWGIDASSGEISDSIICNSFEEAIENCQVIILPLPASTDGIRINCPLTHDLPPVRLSSLLDKLEKYETKPLVLGGRLTPAFKTKAAEIGIRVIDYFESEILQIKNALPTAEGALEIAMRELPRTIHSSKSAVIGYGRIAKTLSRMLIAMKSDVTVAARKSSDLAYAVIDGCKPLKINHNESGSSVKDLCCGYDVIFNTVPYWIFDNDIIAKMDNNTLLIDLASAPGGFDINALTKYGKKVLRAVSLPGKCAPVSAGRIIGETIVEILLSEGIIT